MTDLADGETVEVQGSAAKPYQIKNVGGVYSCTCPAWRNQSVAIERRTCKHIRKLRGDEAELERIGGELPKRSSKKKETEGPPLLLAQAWDNASDLTDWWMSEKLDGVRAYWDGTQFLSRQGNQYHAPDWFVEGLPKDPLDGELWMDRKTFQKTVSIVRRQDKSDHWRDIRFLVFDAPDRNEAFEDRLEFLEDCLRANKPKYAQFHEHQRCTGTSHLREELERIESLGGEGLMLRQPASPYERGRSFTLLKVKTFYDAEAVVIDHQAGKGKHKGKLGSLVVQLSDGTEFSVGTGLSDAERAAPPTVGSTITFRYQELSDAGVPRFPSYLRLAATAPQADARVRKTPAKKSRPQRAKATTKSPCKENSPVSSNASIRYFESRDDKSSKFWEVSIDGLEVTVRYGRIGADGQIRTKSFDSDEQATAHYEKLIKQKTGKDYVECDRPG